MIVVSLARTPFDNVRERTQKERFFEVAGYLEKVHRCINRVLPLRLPPLVLPIVKEKHVRIKFKCSSNVFTRTS